MTTVQASGWRTALLARLGAAALIGALTGGVALLVGHLVSPPHVAVACRPSSGLGCALGAPIADFLISALVWLVVVCVATYGAGLLLTGASALAFGVRIGITAPLAWPVTLWAIAALLKPFGVTIHLTNAAVIGYVVIALTVTATLTAPQLRLATRLVVTGALVCAVLVALLVR